MSSSVLMMLRTICFSSALTVGKSRSKDSWGELTFPPTLSRQLTRTVLLVKFDPIFKSASEAELTAVARVACESDGTTGLDSELFADDVLQAELVRAVVDAVRAEELEVAFVVERGTDGALPRKVDGIARIFVHEHAHVSLRVHVDKEIEADSVAAGMGCVVGGNFVPLAAEATKLRSRKVMNWLLFVVSGRSRM